MRIYFFFALSFAAASFFAHNRYKYESVCGGLHELNLDIIDTLGGGFRKWLQEGWAKTRPRFLWGYCSEANSARPAGAR